MSLGPRVVSVRPLEDYRLELLFSDEKKKVFDVRPYLQHGLFSELADKDLFNSVAVCMGTVAWQNGLDICPDTLYLESH
jgi:hypothetical protein